MNFCKKCNLYLKLSPQNLCLFCKEEPKPKPKPTVSLNRALRSCKRYKEWVKEIKLRDRFCVLCNKEGSHVDHIKPLSLLLGYFDLKTIKEALSCPDLWQIENGRFLCKECHGSQPSTPKNLKSFGCLK